VIPSQLADSVKNNPTLAGVPLDNPQVQKFLGTSLDNSKVQAEGDQAVDGIYNWLEGKSPQPKISIDVSPDSSSLSDAATKYAATLPACAPGQSPGTDVAANPLAATCLPPGVSVDAIRSYVNSQIADNPALTATPPLTQDDIKLTQGKTIMDSFGFAPKVYHWAQLLPLISGVAIIIFMVLLLLILRPVRGTRSIGKHLLSVGITLGVCAWLLAWGLEKGLSTFLPKNANPNVGDALTKLTNLFDDAYRDNIVHLSEYMAAAGLVLFVLAIALGFILKKRSRAAGPVADTTSLSGSTNRVVAIPLAPATAATSVATKPKTATRKKTTTKKPPAAHKKPVHRKKPTKKSI
jgi:hypothetical protein